MFASIVTYSMSDLWRLKHIKQQVRSLKRRSERETSYETHRSRNKDDWRGVHYTSHLANTSSAFMLVCRRLTLEHPVQIIKGFIDVWRLGPGPRTLRQAVAELALRAALHPSVAEPTWWRIEQGGAKEEDEGMRYRKRWKTVGGGGGQWSKKEAK